MKKSTVILLFGLLLGASAVFKSEHPVFPSTRFTNLEGKIIPLPDSAKGKYSIVFTAVNRQGLDSLMTWVGPAYKTFVNPPQTNSVLVKTDYNVNLYYILATKGMPQNISGLLVDTLRRQNDLDLVSKVLLYNEPVQNLSSALKITDPNNVYTFLLDYNGKIVYTAPGAYSVKRLNKLTDILADTK